MIFSSLSKKPRHNAHWVWFQRTFGLSNNQCWFRLPCFPWSLSVLSNLQGENQLEINPPCARTLCFLPCSMSSHRGFNPLLSFWPVQACHSQSWGGSLVELGEEMWNKGPKSCPVPHLGYQSTFLSSSNFLFCTIEYQTILYILVEGGRGIIAL